MTPQERKRVLESRWASPEMNNPVFKARWISLGRSVIVVLRPQLHEALTERKLSARHWVKGSRS